MKQTLFSFSDKKTHNQPGWSDFFFDILKDKVKYIAPCKRYSTTVVLAVVYFSGIYTLLSTFENNRASGAIYDTTEKFKQTRNYEL